MKLSKALADVMNDNGLCVTAYSRYLNHDPRFVTEKMVRELAEECGCSCHDAYCSLLSAAMGLEPDDPTHRRIERLYLLPGVRELDPLPYLSDAYCQRVELPKRRLGSWETLLGSYAAYEPFVWRDPILRDDLREIPQIGYFTKPFRFPAIHERGVEWMSVKPNEVETMRAPISRARGHVLTLGLGMGYFAFHAGMKEEVESVTVVERDPQVIRLFKEWILPQFPCQDKLRIVEGDALYYMKHHLKKNRYDYIFADLWHDASDGLPLYRELKRSEAHVREGTLVDYWVEDSILSYLRGLVFEKLLSLPEDALGGMKPEDCLKNEYLKKL